LCQARAPVQFAGGKGVRYAQSDTVQDQRRVGHSHLGRGLRKRPGSWRPALPRSRAIDPDAAYEAIEQAYAELRPELERACSVAFAASHPTLD
jgi:hypothetical protein